MRRITAIALAAALGLSACASDGASSTIEANAGVDFEVEVGVAPVFDGCDTTCLLYTSPSPRDRTRSRMPSSA